MTDLIEVKTADLVGEQLAWAVGKAEGLDVRLAPPIYGNPWRVFARYRATATDREALYNPHESWALAGPLIFKHKISIDPRRNAGTWDAYSDRWVNACETPQVAVCLAVVVAKLGHSVQVPKELMP
ncbi:phage protein NinX family protein [Pseudomonas sp. NPDC089392]|uniref:phage protein NinX family protein n=1 Tax=Pseudomonas sp. NPDC089392 TaxID=3364459 RepID=UPI00382F1563